MKGFKFVLIIIAVLFLFLFIVMPNSDAPLEQLSSCDNCKVAEISKIQKENAEILLFSFECENIENLSCDFSNNFKHKLETLNITSDLCNSYENRCRSVITGSKNKFT